MDRVHSPPFRRFRWDCCRSFPLRLQPAARPSLHVLGAPFHDRIGVEFFAVRTPHILNRMALAQCASCPEGIIHRRQQSGPFQLGVTILEIVNLPVLRFAHFCFPFAFSPSSTSRRMASGRLGLPDRLVALGIRQLPEAQPNRNASFSNQRCAGQLSLVVRIRTADAIPTSRAPKNK